MKTIFSVLALCVISFFSAAQNQVPLYSIGIGAGFTQSFTDAYSRNVNLKPSVQTTFDYNFNQFTTAGIELQGGKVSGGINPVDDRSITSPRYFDSKYAAAFINGKMQLGQLIKNPNSGFLNAVKRIYIGAGLGLIGNDHDDRIDVENSAGNESTYTVNYKSMDMIIPLLTGINFYVKDMYRETRLIINLNLQVNMLPYDLMDGYEDVNNRPDVYTMGSVGIKIPFGPRKTYFNSNLNNFSYHSSK